MRDEMNLRAAWVALVTRLRDAGAVVELHREPPKGGREGSEGGGDRGAERSAASAWHAAAVLSVDADGGLCVRRPASLREPKLEALNTQDGQPPLWQVVAVGGGSRLLGRCRVEAAAADGRDTLRLSPPVDLTPADPRRAYRWRANQECPVRATLEPSHSPVIHDRRAGDSVITSVAARLTNLSPRGVGVLIDSGGLAAPVHRLHPTPAPRRPRRRHARPRADHPPGTPGPPPAAAGRHISGPSLHPPRQGIATPRRGTDHERAPRTGTGDADT